MPQHAEFVLVWKVLEDKPAYQYTPASKMIMQACSTWAPPLMTRRLVTGNESYRSSHLAARKYGAVLDEADQFELIEQCRGDIGRDKH
jgi:hypothetical protein